MIEVSSHSFKRYYLIYLLPLVIMVILLFLANFSLIQVAIFCFFYLWNLVLNTKSLRDVFMQKKMRLSFLRQLYNIDLIFIKIFRNIYLAKYLQLIVFSTLVYFAYDIKNMAFAFSGGIFLEIIKKISSSLQNRTTVEIKNT